MLLLVLAATVSLRAQSQDPLRFTDKVDVARILLDVRAIDPRGRPLLGLEPADFEVRIDGRVARVETVQRVTGAPVVIPGTAATTRETDFQLATHGRLVVFLFQNSLERSRTPGLMRMLLGLRSSLESLAPTDHVAILRFDSRLQLLLDFTQDKEVIRKALEHDVLFGAATTPRGRQAPSLRPTLDEERDTPSYSMERSLLRIAEALTPLPGAKSVVIVGHGFGRLSSMGVLLDSEYDDAREALQAARASVFCLDVTEADYHSLEAGLKTVADDTGGLYQRTHIFSQAALDRVMAALEGQYVLFVDRPELSQGSHTLDVRLKRRDGVVLAPAVYVK